MSFYNDASLVFLPSGGAGKDGKAYSMKPTDGSGDFTFSRGSNLTATRVDSNGLIEKGRENLLTQSNNFSSSDWTKFGSPTLTSGQSGYDGSSDAWLYESTTISHSILQFGSFNGVYTWSVYAKAGTADGIRLRFDAATDSNIYVDLTDGSIITDDSDIAYKIESVGNGWYRLSITSNVSTLSNVRLNVTDNVGAQTTGNIYIQDAQLEQGLVATEYIESGATTGKAGILEDSPRFDYSGGASCGSLLLEGSRTNILEFSEYFEDSFYIKDSGVTATSNQVISPEGKNNGSLISVQSSGRLYANHTSGTYISSVFIKAGTFSHFKIIGQNVDLTTSPISVGSLDFEDYGNGWYRIYGSYTGNRGFQVQAYPDNTYSSHTDSGDYYIFGAQVEAGSYPTSYIPNHSGGSVTRDADVSTLLNQSGVIGQTAGTILFDAYFDEADKVNFSISDSSVSNFISIETTSSNEVTAKVEQGGSTQATITTTTSFFAEGDRLKCAIAYDDRDMAFYINGTQVNTAAPNLIPACDDVRFGNYDGSIKADQRVNRVVLFTTRISNGNLATLTS